MRSDFDPRIAPKSGVAPPADRSLWGIVLTNVLVLILALSFDWPLSMMLWPYWLQSIVIGAYNVRRILVLDRYTTDGLRINDRAVDPTPETKLKVAGFFAFHFGFFHFVYFIFLSTLGTIPEGDMFWIAAMGLAFVLSHGFSHAEHIRHDLDGGTNAGTLMFMPYLRVIPMHLTMIFGMGIMEGGRGAVILFALLKTIADIVTHRIEHRLMHRSRAKIR